MVSYDIAWYSLGSSLDNAYQFIGQFSMEFYFPTAWISGTLFNVIEAYGIMDEKTADVCRDRTTP